MKKAKVFVDDIEAGELQELKLGTHYRFAYKKGYDGQSVSLEMPTNVPVYEYTCFPPFFEGLLPEGIMLDSLLRQAKIDRNDVMSQLIAVGRDLVGNVTVEAVDE
jgi:serine/threonine-protein kinase HipA